MTGKERILKALESGEPDRVPVFGPAINESGSVKLRSHFTEDGPSFYRRVDRNRKEADDGSNIARP